MAGAPEWLSRVAPTIRADLPPWFAQHPPPPDPPRRSAVLLLFGGRHEVDGTTQGLDVVLTERSARMRSHAAQVAFPGGHVDPDDDGPIGAAVREAEEEVGVRPDSVEVVDALPPLYLTPSQMAVTPVLAWWSRPHPIGVIDDREVARVVRADVAHLLDPANRFTVTGPGGYRGPGFDVDGLFVWGFTATLLAHVLDVAGLDPGWDDSVHRPLPHRLLAPYLTPRGDLG